MPSATKYCLYKPKGTTNTKIVNGKSVSTLSKSNRCKTTDNEKENSPNECEVDSLSGNCGLRDPTGRASLSRENARKHSRRNNTSRVHVVGKVANPSACSLQYHETGICGPNCKLTKSYTNSKTGKLVKGSCRANRVKETK